LTSGYEDQIADPFLVGLLMAKSAIAMERGIGFSIESDGIDNVRLVGTRELITILGNLVDNALDSVTGPRNTGGTVHVELRRQGASLAMSVSDNGPGIPLNIRNTMFQEGFTTKSTDTHSGIGLALVSSSVEAREGTIRVEYDNGTTFHVSIPIVFDMTEERAM
jgi:two-component system CitB family sensor kinase